MALPHYKVSRDAAVNNTAQTLSTGPGAVAYFQLTNGGVVDADFHFYDVAAAGVTVGSTTPKCSFSVPAGTGATVRGGYEYNGPPIEFETAITYSATQVDGSSDPAVAPKLGVIVYKG